MMIEFNKILDHSIYQERSRKIDKNLVEHQLRRMLFHQLRDKGNLMTSAAWYLTEDQAIKFARMTYDDLNDPESIASKELSLLEQILAQRPFNDVIERDCITFIDLGCGNGVKANRILRDLNLGQVNYYAIDTSPYMGLFCITHLTEKLFETENPKEKGKCVFVSVGQITDDAITYMNEFNKEKLIQEIREHKNRLRELQKAFLDLKNSEFMKHYLDHKETVWNSLVDHEKILAQRKDEQIWQFVLAGETALDNELVEKGDNLTIYRKLKDLYFHSWNISYAELKNRLDHIEKLLFNISTDSKDEMYIFEPHLPQKYLDECEQKLTNIDDIFQDRQALQLAKIALGSTLWEVGYLSAKKEIEEFKKDLEAGKYGRAWGHIRMLEQDLHSATFLKTNGYREIYQHFFGRVHADHVRFRGQGTNRPGPVDKVDREFFLVQPLSIQYCDFLNGDMMKLLKSVTIDNSLRHSHQLIGLLGQTIGNFTEQDRKKIVKQIYDSLEPGGYLLLGAELRPPNNDPMYHQKIQKMRKYYGAPELNEGKKGPCEEFLRYATKQLGIKDEDLDYKVEYNNNTIEMIFEAKNSIKLVHEGNEVILAKGQRIPAATSYKFTIQEITDLIQDTGFKIQYNPDRYGYTVVLAKK